MTAPDRAAPPPRDCALCPRLAAFRAANRQAFPEFFNAPVPSFGDTRSRLLVVGLAPGLRGANRTGRPFTGDYAGLLLYPALIEFGFARGRFDARPDDGLELVDCRVTNAVRCVPPENKPTTAEGHACRPFLQAEIAAMGNLKALLALGGIAHNAVLATLGLRLSHYKFGHEHVHDLPNGLRLFDSYHSSRYNVNTGRLTEPMFHAVFVRIRKEIPEGP